MDMHQLRLASSLVATWQYTRIYQAPVPKKYANLCSSHDCSFVHCALGRIIDWRFRWRAGRGRRVGHQGGSNCLGETHMFAFGGKADMTLCRSPLSRSLSGVKRASHFATHMSAIDPKRT